MTMVIRVDNVNSALSEGLWLLRVSGLPESSRNGNVLVAPEPVITEYTIPQERVLFSPIRDANPFFHMMEALWMLGGREDVEWPARFNTRMRKYSDNGDTLHGAYGYRWRGAFGFDQLNDIVNILTYDPISRRAVLQMWDATADLNVNGKDLPCNTHAYFDVRNGVLNMTVCCRSNDAVWGAYGANAVHFSMLQEYIAAGIGVGVGVYRQMSNNLHIYTDLFTDDLVSKMAFDASSNNLYANNLRVTYTPMISSSWVQWGLDLRKFLSDPLGDTAYSEAFFNNVAAPMYTAWLEYKTGNMYEALSAASNITAEDWRIACTDWLRRRE